MTRYTPYTVETKEPELQSIGGPDSDVYRFRWEPSFHPPVSFTLENTAGEKTLTVKTLGWSDPGDPEFCFIDGTKGVSAEKWDTFLKLLEKADYWVQPSVEGPVGFDGAQWVLEARKGERHHVVNRWSPNDRSTEVLRFREACLYLVALSGQSTRPLY